MAAGRVGGRRSRRRARADGGASGRADVDGLSGGGHPDFRLNEAGE